MTLTDHEQGVLANMCDCVAANAPPAAPPAVIGAGARAPHPGPGLARLRLASASSASSLGGSLGLHGGVRGCSGDSLYDLGFDGALERGLGSTAAGSSRVAGDSADSLQGLDWGAPGVPELPEAEFAFGEEDLFGDAEEVADLGGFFAAAGKRGKQAAWDQVRFYTTMHLVCAFLKRTTCHCPLLCNVLGKRCLATFFCGPACWQDLRSQLHAMSVPRTPCTCVLRLEPHRQEGPVLD